MSPSFDTQPASFLQQFNAWKEQVVRYQQLSGENLPDFIKLTAVVNGLKGQVRHHVLMQLDGGSSFGDLDSLLQKYFNNTYVQSESSLNSVWDKAWRDNQAKDYKQEGAKGKSKGKGKGKGKPSKGKGEAYPSQPASSKGKGKQQQLPKNQQWCSVCFKKGHLAQACWWNPDPYQQQNQHQKGAAWPTKGQQQPSQAWGQQPPWPQQTSAQWLGGSQSVQWLGGPQPQLYSMNQPATYASLPPDNQSMLSLEPPSQASTQPVRSAPVFTIAMLKKSFQPFSRASKTWGILVDTGAATSVAPKGFASHMELSPIPPTLQLTTATGKANETYGLRRVHLHSQGLSFEVAFVIADVVTPLLGLNSMLHESLSLHVGQNSKHFLVAPGGARTQLEHKGKHLYLTACPSKLGSSNLIMSSLSKVVGFLPSDTQLDDEKLALSSSSSSTDLVEDLIEQEASSKDTWYSHCHPVFEEASEDDSEPSFDLVPGRQEVADAGGEPQSESFHPKYLRQPRQPSKQERELHNMTHIPFQPWCVVCQEAKGRGSQHRKQRASTKTSKIQLDYAYIRQPQDKEPTTILTWVESLTGLAGSLMTAKKGVTQVQLDAVITFIKRQGFSQSALQCDGEPALVKLVEEIGKQTSLPTRQSPAYSHQSQAYVEGWHRSLFAQFRALLFDFCHRYKLEPSEIKMGGSFSQHMLRHAVWLLNRFQLH